MRALTDDTHSGGLREKCGVFGAYGLEDAAAIAVFGLHALQHRGEEGAGVITYNNEANTFHDRRSVGRVMEIFNDANALKRDLPGNAAIGHVRYSTQGGSSSRNLQPLYADLDVGGFAIAHNGNLTNALTLRRDLVKAGAIFHSLADTEVIVHLVARSREDTVLGRFVDALSQLEGGYALVGLTDEFAIGARDPLGIRPLVLGRKDGAYVLVSETCALDMIDATFERDVAPGEIVLLHGHSIKSFSLYAEAKARDLPLAMPPGPMRPCLFEYVYFSRPDSKMNGRSIYDGRKRIGAELFAEHPRNVDVVVPVPDSGVPAALGYAQSAGLPFELGIIRNHYAGRTFIQPTQQIRQQGVRRKHSANRAVIEGKRVLLIDDSIVRGNTSRQIVEIVKEAGPKEIHFLSASPMVTHPDYYGIDMPAQHELLANRKSLQEMRLELKVESLGFLSIDGLYMALGAGPRDAAAPLFADHYFTGEYPTARTDIANGLIDPDAPRGHATRQQHLDLGVRA
ncbi:MAG: amidophosphoribosyltransferase [Maricaulaceae bacterium]